MTPTESAHLLLVPKELINAILATSQIMVVDCAIFGAGAEHVGAPAERTYATLVPIEFAHHFLRLQVPHLYNSSVGTHR